MKRPMCILAVSWLAGLVLAGHGTALQTKSVLFFYIILIIFGLLILKKSPHLSDAYVRRERYPQLTLFLFLIPCLFLMGHWRMEHFLAQQAKKELPWKLLEEEEETYVTLEGIVKEKSGVERVELELTECVIIGYYGEENRPAGDCLVWVEEEGKEWLPETFAGNRIRVFGTFSVFQPAGNPGQFDAYDYYSGKGLYASVSALRISLLEGNTSRFRNLLFTLKQKMTDSFIFLYPKEKAGVLTAMTLGDKDLLPEEIEDLYRKNGISHILAISGLHISLLCMGLFELLRKLTVPPKAAAAVTICFLAFYVFFTGVSVSSLRAGIMCLVVLGAKLLRRSYDLLSSLSMAAIVVTGLRPAELTSAGFLLSFGAVLGVALAKEAEDVVLQQREGRRPWWLPLLFGGMLQCVTMPVSLWFFYELSPYGILLNLVVIPLVSLILCGGILSAVLGMFWPAVARLPAGGTYLLLDFYERLCEAVQKLPFSYVLLGRPVLWQIIAYYVLLAVVLWLFLTKTNEGVRHEKYGKTGRFVIGVLCAAGILFLPDARSAEVLFLDVSQGDGALITTEGGVTILSDCGSTDVTQVGEYRLSPMLKQKGIGLLDMAVVSHLDSDHMSGIKELLNNMPVYAGTLWFAAHYEGEVGVKELVLPAVSEKSETYLELEALASEKNVAVRYMQAGEVLYQEEEMLIECLHPDKAVESENDTSLVFLLQTPGLMVWLMGDAGTGPEKDIMKLLNMVDTETLRDGRLVLLKAGHHGSKTSSGEAFIDFVKPDVAVISCGYQNIYGHPHAEVLERLAASKAEVFRTDLHGAVAVEISRHRGIVVRSWRKQAGK